MDTITLKEVFDSTLPLIMDNIHFVIVALIASFVLSFVLSLIRNSFKVRSDIDTVSNVELFK